VFKLWLSLCTRGIEVYDVSTGNLIVNTVESI
jgi:hypothetical protein